MKSRFQREILTKNLVYRNISSPQCKIVGHLGQDWFSTFLSLLFSHIRSQQHPCLVNQGRVAGPSGNGQSHLCAWLIMAKVDLHWDAYLFMAVRTISAARVLSTGWRNLELGAWHHRRHHGTYSINRLTALTPTMTQEIGNNGFHSKPNYLPLHLIGH
jgi:hypothetical protein